MTIYCYSSCQREINIHFYCHGNYFEINVWIVLVSYNSSKGPNFDLILLLLWVFMLIKGYVVPLRAQGLSSRTSECAIKSLDNSSFKMDLYISGKS